MRTSPLPPENVWSASRALLSWTTVFLRSAVRNACACAGDLPCAIWLPYAAMMFQRAPPEVNGFGVTIFTPGLARSFQPVMCFGFPLRTPRATTESVTIPLCGPALQFAVTMPSFTSLVTSGSSENATTSAWRPPSTVRLWSPEAPYDCVNWTPFPAGVCWKPGISSAYASFGVEYGTSAVLPPPPAPPLDVELLDFLLLPHPAATTTSAARATTSTAS